MVMLAVALCFKHARIVAFPNTCASGLGSIEKYWGVLGKHARIGEYWRDRGTCDNINTQLSAVPQGGEGAYAKVCSPKKLMIEPKHRG